MSFHSRTPIHLCCSKHLNKSWRRWRWNQFVHYSDRIKTDQVLTAKEEASLLLEALERLLSLKPASIPKTPKDAVSSKSDVKQ